MQFHFGGWRLESDCGHVKALFIVEHYAETVLPIVDQATIVLVNGKIAFEGDAGVMERVLTCRPACWGLFIATMPAPRLSPRREPEIFRMNLNMTGATRLNIIVGDPIQQVKAPGGLTRAFAGRGYDGILVPVQVGVEDLGDFLAAADRLKNLDSIVVTVPHKFSCFRHCKSATERAGFLGAVNLMRRRPDGGWHGEMVDGVGFVGAVRAQGYDPRDKRALLIGAGGAGSAIALALVDAQVRELAIHDEDVSRRDNLILRLNALGKAKVVAGSPDPTGFDLIANATPAGMKEGDPLPVDVAKLSPATFVGCVITVPAVSPLVEAARKLGCPTSTGTDMYHALEVPMLDFLLAPLASR